MKMNDVILGFAIGDAFGAGVEFQDRDWIRANVDFSRFVNARASIAVPAQDRWRFTENYTAWDYTDDTEMTIGLMKALMTDAPFTAGLLVQKWQEEYEKGKQEKGYGRNGHGSMAWYYTGEKTLVEIRDFQRNRPNPGNAAAMRAMPLGFVEEKHLNEYAAVNANATHPNAQAIISSQCIARATAFLLVHDGAPKDLIAYCKKTIALTSIFEQYLTEVDKLGKYETLKTADFELLCGKQPIETPYFLAGIKGVPSDAMYTTGSVLYILKHSTTAFDALQKAIYLGGDVDSLASIATGIMAGRMGLESLPNFMQEHIEAKAYLLDIAERFEKQMKIR